MEDIKIKVFGIEQSYTLDEISAILEEHREMKGTTYGLREKIMIGRWFRVTPATINQKLFQEKRENWYQEEFRQRILEVFKDFKRYPERLRPFKTIVPFEEGAWSAEGLDAIADKYDGHVANWYEQELEWAQRISNGESWEEVCNEMGGPRKICYIVRSSKHYLVGLRNKNGTYKDDLPLTSLYCAKPMKPLVVSYKL